jgi:hypothetical protein
MQLLCDNDFWIKLAHHGLLQMFHADVFRVGRADCFRLAALPRKLRVDEVLRGDYGSQRCSDLADEAENYPKLRTGAIDRTTLNRFLALNQVDPGEAHLFAAAVGNKDLVVCTHDKHALRCLFTAPSIKDLRSDLMGRVVTVETAIVELVAIHGDGAIRQKLTSPAAIDGAVKRILQGESLVNPARRYVSDLEAACGHGLCWAAKSP